MGTKSNIAVIGEAPGKHEALQGEPFVGRAGQVLNDGLALAGLGRDNVWIQNVICCRPPQNKFDKAETVGAVDACRPWFNAQLDASGAWLVVLAGKKAYQAVTDDDSPLGWVRGKFQWFADRLWVPIWHPAYVLRAGPDGDVASQYRADWKAIGHLLAGEVDGPDPEPEMVLGATQLRMYEPETGGNTRLRQRLDLDGWCGIYSEVIGDYMCIVDTRPRRTKPKIPAKWRRQPQWTTGELMRISAGGKLTVGVEQVRRINLAKRVLGGRVVA